MERVSLLWDAARRDLFIRTQTNEWALLECFNCARYDLSFTCGLPWLQRMLQRMLQSLQCGDRSRVIRSKLHLRSGLARLLAHLGIVPPNYIWISKEPREKSVNSIRRLIAHKHTPVNDGKNWRMRDRMCDGEKEKWPEELDTALSRCSYQRSVDPHSEMMAGMQNLNWIRSNFQYLIKHSSIWLCSEWANTDNIYRIFKRLLELNLFHTVLQEAKLNGGQLEEPSRSQNRIYKAYFIVMKMKTSQKC